MTYESQKVRTFSFAKYGALILAAVSFIVPFILSQQQLPTGVFVNALLYLAVLFLPASTRLPIIILPSLASAARGLVFGSLTMFLLMFIPVIWLGNWLLTVVFDQLRTKVGMIPAGIAGAVTKVGVLYLTAVTLVHFHVVPKLFLTTMGSMQLVTALIGFVVALGIYHFVSTRRT